MRKNKFCTFTLIVALAIAALPASLAAAGGTDGAGGASKWFGRPSDPSLGTAGWARYEHNLGWFPRVTGE